MKTIQADIWDFHTQGYFTVIPTNTTRKRNGDAVMGAGLALAAAQRFPDLSQRYGEVLAGDMPERPWAGPSRLLLVPTKRDWRREADIFLIRDGVEWLIEYFSDCQVALPLLGAGRGQIPVATIRRYLEERCAGCAGWVLCLPPGETP